MNNITTGSRHTPPSAMNNNLLPIVVVLLLWTATLFEGVVAQPLSCACALEQFNHSINCNASTNQDTLNKAMSDLQANNCDQNCPDSEICQRAYYVVQAHHDYCLSNEVPLALSTVFHNFEGLCTDCHVIRKTNPSLELCPQADCENDAGKVAYEYLLIYNCQEDCNTRECALAFQILRSVYETCPDGTLSILAELAINDWDEPCAAQDCNTGSTATDDSQLVCDADAPLVTRPPAASASTFSPTTTPLITCPEVPKEDSEYVIGDEPVCEICGAGKCIAKPEEVFRWPNRPVIKCQDLQDAALQGFINFDQCEALPDLMSAICGCGLVDRYVPFVPPVDPSTGMANTKPQRDDSRNGLSSTTSSSEKKKDDFGVGFAVGIGAAIGLIILGVGGLIMYRRHRIKTRQNNFDVQKDDPALVEIEVATIQPTGKQEIA